MNGDSGGLEPDQAGQVSPERTVRFAGMVPSPGRPYHTAVLLTARRHPGPPPSFGFNVFGSAWMGLDATPVAEYPNTTISADDVHRLANGFSQMIDKLPTVDVSSAFGVVVTYCGYSHADYTPGTVEAAMAYWVADEFAISRPDTKWVQLGQTDQYALQFV